MMERMAAKPRPEKHTRPSAAEMDERITIPLDPETAIEALLKVDPDSPEVAAARQEIECPADETDEG
jgi:hypothetical protein